MTVKPTSGTLTLSSSTGVFTYTPTEGARRAAGFTVGADTATFTVTVSDGKLKIPTVIAVPVTPTYLAANTAAIPVGTHPVGVVLKADGKRAYVLNEASNSVSVIDTTNGVNTVIKTIQVGTAPSSIAITKSGNKVYVSNAGSNTVSIITTSSNTVTATIQLTSTPTSVAVTPTGSRIYVATVDGLINKYSSSNKLVGTNRVGLNPTKVVFGADGKNAFVVNGDLDTLSVINLSKNTVKIVEVGDNPVDVVPTPDKKQVYVVNGGGTITAIRTDINVVSKTIPTGGNPYSAVISPDSGTLYVASRNGALTAIDTKSNTVLGAITTGTTPDTGVPHLVFSPDGKTVYLTDRAAGLLRVLTVTTTAPNYGPVTTDLPSASTPNPVTGTITGNLNVVDPNNDPLTYVVNRQPTSGTVTVDPTTGVYSYTPTPGARLTAGATPQTETDSFVIDVSDGFNPALSVSVSGIIVAPTYLATSQQPIAVETNPAHAVVGPDGRVYVLNSLSGSVSVITPDGSTESSRPRGLQPPRPRRSRSQPGRQDLRGHRRIRWPRTPHRHQSRRHVQSVSGGEASDWRGRQLRRHPRVRRQLPG